MRNIGQGKDTDIVGGEGCRIARHAPATDARTLKLLGTCKICL